MKASVPPLAMLANHARTNLLVSLLEHNLACQMHTLHRNCRLSPTHIELIHTHTRLDSTASKVMSSDCKMWVCLAYAWAKPCGKSKTVCGSHLLLRLLSLSRAVA